MVIRFRYRKLGGHYHFRMFVGKDFDHLAKAGDFIIREEEFHPFMDLMRSQNIQFKEEGE